MSSSSESGTGPSHRWALATGALLVALTGLGLGAGIVEPATAGVAPTASLAAASTGRSAPASPDRGRIADDGDPRPGDNRDRPSADGWVQLRCWQYGRLLFDEGPVRLASETRLAARLVARRHDGGTLLVSEAGSATCLARPAAPPRPLSLPQ